MSKIVIRGASEHNLRNVSLEIPRNTLTVFTGVSGSGKSSLAFDTIYKEGQRRFLESLSAYARQFLGGFEKPKVESIEGLSPTISIDQKTVGRSPRSTVGTITEVHDHLRLLYARIGEPHCPQCGRKVEPQSAQRICERVLERHAGHTALVLAPVVRGRKGEYRQLLEDLARDGYTRVRIDGVMLRLGSGIPSLKRHERHVIEVVCDRLEVRESTRSRWTEAIEKALQLTSGLLNIAVLAPASPESGSTEAPVLEEEVFSSLFSCPFCGISLPEMEPRLFSFNSPHGSCKACDGLGETDQVDPELVIVDPSLPFKKGGIAGMLATGEFVDDELDTEGFVALGERMGFSPRSSWGDLDEKARQAVLDGDGRYAGLVPALASIAAKNASGWIAQYVRNRPCKDCGGSRLRPEARAVKFQGKSIVELGSMTVQVLKEWLLGLSLEGGDTLVGQPILKNVISRLKYLEDVGLNYLTLDRRSNTLAGGEAQRLRLASQVGAGLQGVLFVLDEPSIGLHPRDNQRLLETLAALRDLGNTVLVVEHDQATMELADHLVDVGPGAGENGGFIVAEGDVEAVMKAPESITGKYLSGERTIAVPQVRREPGEHWLELRGVTHNNLRGVNVRIPLGCFVVVTGVSGSGKSSLVNHVLRPALLEKLGRHTARPGRYKALLGYQRLDKLVDIDQSPIGRTPRSNPATYVKVFDLIRDLYAQVPEARARGYKAGRFSFNKDGGRCLECGGAGVSTVEMQFLPAVEVICDACGARRYNRETLEIHYRSKSIYDVLEMPIAEAAEFFREHPKIHRPIEMLRTVGLGYMKLGQPSTTLSGGEAQRVKLASELKRRDTGRTLYLFDEPTTGLHFEDTRVLLEALQELVGRGNTVLVIEHSVDVIKVADHVIDLGPEGGDGGGRIVAEGTPEVVSRVESSHTARALREALAPRDERIRKKRPRGGKMDREQEVQYMEVFGARKHNLKSIHLRVPHNALTVVTGVSGSGKTSLAFDTVFAEGQRRYLESLSTYARRFLGRMQGAECDRVTGLRPAIAIDQKSASANPRSTVATITEVHDYLRLLYARIGRAHCTVCGAPLEWTSPTRLSQELVTTRAGEKCRVLALVQHLPTEGMKDHEIQRAVESIRSSLLKDGFTRAMVGGEEIRLDEDGDTSYRRLLASMKQSLLDSRSRGAEGAPLFVVVDRVVLAEASQSRLAGSLELAFERGGGKAAVLVDGGSVVFHTRSPACPLGHMELTGELTPSMFSFSSLQGACARCKGIGIESRADSSRLIVLADRPVVEALDPALRRFLEAYRPSTIQVIHRLLELRVGNRNTPYSKLGAEDRDTIFRGAPGGKVPLELKDGTVIEIYWPGLVTHLEEWAQEESLGEFAKYFSKFFEPQTCSVCGGGRLRKESLLVRLGGLNIQDLTRLTVSDASRFMAALELSDREQTIAQQVLREIQNRLRFLDEVGLGYLSLDRTAGTLSGGEAQRIRLASQLGNRLSGVLYVLDEPTVGLHPRDTQRLIDSLKSLKDLGNTVLLVEHDRETMEAADWLIDIGPGAGVYGGEVMAQGTPAKVASSPTSLTGRYLSGSQRVHDRVRPPGEPTGWLRLRNVTHNNLTGLDAAFPLGVITVVTGVSGSGKSSLVLDVLSEVVEAELARRPPSPGRVSSVEGLDQVRRLVVVDQKPIGRSPRSNPATYSGIWDHVRELYSLTQAAKVRGFGVSRFSFNTGEGRCMTCDGQGATQVEMHFLSDVWVPCELCKGKRFDRETLGILFKGKNVSDVLAMDVSEACVFFESQHQILRILQAMEKVGLGYVKLGQPGNTLSGGEAQRLKLASELVTREGGGSLYILDEPTTGLHFEDVGRLIGVFEALVEGGNTLVVIEHHLDVIRAADWVIDLGPEAGEAGGRIVVEGAPARIASSRESHTGRALRGER